MSSSRWFGALVAVASVACSASKAGNAPDSATVAAARVDSVMQAAAQQAPALRTAAEADIATLLKDPKSATFDSVKVIQPPEANGRWPAIAVCGTVSGKPGVGGRATPTAFIYQSRQAVFVDDAKSHQAFGELWGRLCADPKARVVP